MSEEWKDTLKTYMEFIIDDEDVRKKSLINRFTVGEPLLNEELKELQIVINMIRINSVDDDFIEDMTNKLNIGMRLIVLMDILTHRN